MSQRLTTSGLALERRYGRLVAVILLLAAVVWVAVVHSVVAVLPFDDAFITFRYAENLAAGAGPVYNEGEHVFGSSTPLYLLWLAGVRVVAGDTPLPELAVRLNAVWLSLAGIAAFVLLRRLTGSHLLAAAGAAPLMLNRSMLVASTGGMESFLFVSLVLLALWAFSERRAVAFGALAGLALMTRPEGGVLIGLTIFWRPPSVLRRVLVSWGSVVGLWVLTATYYYGTPIPHSVIAKMQPIYPLPKGIAVDLARVGVTGLLSEIWQGPWLGPASAAVWALLSAGAVSCLWHPHPRQLRSWGAAAFLFGTLALYLVGNPMIFPWYWPHLFAPALVMVLVGAQALGRVGESLLLRHGSRMAGWVLPIAVCLSLVWVLGSLLSPYLRGPSGWMSVLTDVSENPERLRVLAYRQVAEELNRLGSEGERLAAPEIGSLGFYYRGPVLDGCGLVTPEAIPFLPVAASERSHQANGAISEGFVQATEPTWVVSMPVFAAQSLLRSEWFRENYDLVGRVPLPKELWSSTEVLVMRRKEVHSPTMERRGPG